MDEYQIEELDDRRKSAWRLFLTAHARLIDGIDQTLVAADVLPFEWYDVLLALEEATEGSLRIGELGDVVLISRSGLTRLVDKLEAAGYLRREPSLTDRRATNVVITERGLAARRDSWPVYRRAIVRYFAQFLSDDETQILESAFRRMLYSAQATAGNPTNV